MVEARYVPLAAFVPDTDGDTAIPDSGEAVRRRRVSVPSTSAVCVCAFM